MTITVNKDIILRNYVEEDVAELFATVDENRVHLRPWLLWVDGTQKPAHSLEYIRAARQEQDDQQSMAFGIFKSGKLIGGLGMRHWDQQLKKAHIGYWLAKTEEGKGILYECAVVFIAYLFDQLQLNKIELQYLTANVRSGALAKRLGFVIEGVLRDHYIMNGTFLDLVVTGLLKREYQQAL